MWVIFLACLFSGSAALTDFEVKAEFMKMAMTCMKDHPLEMDDIQKLKSNVVPKSREPKCLLACTYRKYGSLNDEGKFDKNILYKLTEKAKEGDEKAIENGKKLIDLCMKVNDENVTDGSTGCERAGLMFACVMGNAPKFGFTV